MPAKLKAKPTPPRDLSPWADVPALPEGAESAYCTKMVRRALGHISETHFREMLSRAEFPAADWHLGRLSRWNRTTVDAWLKAQKERGRSDGVGK